jgi:hypothetical protein
MLAPFRYRKLGYIALNVRDVQRTAAFATEIGGLEPAGIAPCGEHFFRLGSDQHCLVLYQSTQPGYERSGWELGDDEQVDRAYAHFSSLGLDPKWVPPDESAVLGIGIAPAFRVREPTTGILMEYYSKMLQKSAPIKNHLVSFAHLGHVVVNVRDCRATTEYVTQNMRFMVSDYAGDFLTALCRAYPNPHHHSLVSFSRAPGRIILAMSILRLPRSMTSGACIIDCSATVYPSSSAWGDIPVRRDLRSRRSDVGVQLWWGVVSGRRSSRVAVYVDGIRRLRSLGRRAQRQIRHDGRHRALAESSAFLPVAHRGDASY